jgi:hypothetical protein
MPRKRRKKKPQPRKPRAPNWWECDPLHMVWNMPKDTPPALGHCFTGDDLRCACGQSWFSHQREPTECRLAEYKIRSWVRAVSRNKKRYRRLMRVGGYPYGASKVEV